MQTNVTKYQPTCHTFIVDKSKTVYRRKPIEPPTLSRIGILFNKLVSNP
ncbi:MAG: hypothetical protein ACMUEL_03635 [Flavobacteriales bacterium Tduv]